MAERELRKLNRRELLQMLLVQCEESERLQQELDDITERFGTMSESYERLKKKLDVKDERLNQKDARIGELVAEVEKLQTEVEEMKKTGATGSTMEAVDRISEIFREAHKTAEEYLRRVGKPEPGVREKKPPVAEKLEKKQNSAEVGKIASIRKKQNFSCAGQKTPAISEREKIAERAKPVERTQKREGTETEFVTLDIAAGGFYG